MEQPETTADAKLPKELLDELKVLCNPALPSRATDEMRATLVLIDDALATLKTAHYTITRG